MPYQYVGNQKYVAIAADAKPSNAPANSELWETDTGKVYLYNGTSWITKHIRGSYSYIIYRDGSTYYCADSAGDVFSFSSDPSVPIQYALDDNTVVGAEGVTVSYKRIYVSPASYIFTGTPAEAFLNLNTQNLWLDMDIGARMFMPQASTSKFLRIHTPAQNNIVTGGTIEENGTVSRNWDAIYLHGHDVATFNQEGVAHNIIQNVNIRNAKRGIYLFSEGVVSNEYFVQGNIFNNIAMIKCKIFTEFERTSTPTAFSRNVFTNFSCQASAGITTNGFKNIMDRGNTLLGVVLFDLNDVGAVSCSIHSSATNTMIFGGHVTYQNFSDAGADSFVVDPYTIKIPAKLTHVPIFGNLTIGGADFNRLMTAPSVKKSGGWLGAGAITSAYGICEGKVQNHAASPSAPNLDADGSYALFTTAAAAGDLQGNRLNTQITRGAFHPYYECKVKLPSIAGIRASFGWVSGATIPVAGADPLANLSGFVIHLESAGSIWKVKTNNGGASSTSANSESVAANTIYLIRIKASGSGTKWHHSINNSAWTEFDTGIPGTTTNLTPMQWIEDISGVGSKLLHEYYFHVESDK